MPPTLARESPFYCFNMPTLANGIANVRQRSIWTLDYTPKAVVVAAPSFFTVGGGKVARKSATRAGLPQRSCTWRSVG